MSIPRLIGLGVAQGLDKAQITYKQAQLKLTNGKIAKIEKYVDKQEEEAKLGPLTEKTKYLGTQIAFLKSNRELRSYNMNEEKQKISESFTKGFKAPNVSEPVIKGMKEMREGIGTIAEKIEWKTNFSRQHEIKESLKDVESKIKGCNAMIKTSEETKVYGNKGTIIKAKADKKTITC